MVPGRTRVLALSEPGNRQLRAFLAVHQARFGRLMFQRRWHRPGATAAVSQRERAVPRAGPMAPPPQPARPARPIARPASPAPAMRPPQSSSPR
jgi:hypothetical protein